MKVKYINHCRVFRKNPKILNWLNAQNMIYLYIRVSQPGAIDILHWIIFSCGGLSCAL